MINIQQEHDLNIDKCKELAKRMDKDEQRAMLDCFPVELAYNRIGYELKRNREVLNIIYEVLTKWKEEDCN